MSRKPLIFSDEDPEIKNAVAALTAAKETLAQKKLFLEKTRKQITEEYEKEHKECWRIIECRLEELKLISDTSPNLSLKDGVLFLLDKDEPESHGLHSLLKKLFE